MSFAQGYAIMLGVIKTILWSINYSEENTAEISDKFYMWLNESSADGSIITGQFCEYLTSGKLKLKELGEYKSDKDSKDTVFWEKDTLYLTAPVINEIASKMNISAIMLKKQLLNDCVLKTDKENSYQIYKKIDSNSKNIYQIPLSGIYPFGAVRMHPDEFSDNPPFRKIPFGLNGERQIYFCINTDEGENCNMYVCGFSGSGKSNAIKKFAVEASQRDFEVLNIGVEDSVMQFDEANYLEISDGCTDDTITPRDVFRALEREKLSEQTRGTLEILKGSIDDIDASADLKKWEDDFFPLLDNETEKEPIVKAVRDLYDSGKLNWYRWCVPNKITVLKAADDSGAEKLLTDFYDHKLKDTPANPCMLIIDECHKMKFTHKGIMPKILRQGRKYGIMVVIITQFLGEEDGKDIEEILDQCLTTVVFKPDSDKKAAKRIGYDLKDSNVYNAVCSIDNHQCIVKGKFCTDTFEVDYPLILKIPK